MDKQMFEKLCEETFYNFSLELKGKLSHFPDVIDLDKGTVLSDENLLALMQTPVPLLINSNNELYYLNDDGEEIIIDPRIESEKIMKDYVGDVFKMLPKVPFYLHCGGIKRKQQEVAASYMVSIVNAFLHGEYEMDIKEVISDYDFSNFKSKNVGGKTFGDILKLVQEDATPVVKFILTCCSTVISESKEKNDALYIGVVSHLRPRGLR
jgi:hypothetical protein